MRVLLTILSLGLGIGYIASCKGMHEGYLDLATGEEVAITKDMNTGLIINKETRQPLYIYVDPIEEDTIYAKTGEVINGHVINKGNKFIYDKDETLKLSADTLSKYKDDDYKAKFKKDGSIKIKNGDRKVIIDKDGTIHEK
jgi:hypothetical protein